MVSTWKNQQEREQHGSGLRTSGTEGCDIIETYGSEKQAPEDQVSQVSDCAVPDSTTWLTTMLHEERYHPARVGGKQTQLTTAGAAGDMRAAIIISFLLYCCIRGKQILSFSSLLFFYYNMY